MRNKRIGRWLACIIVLALALLLTGMVAVRKIRDWPVERAIARFRTAPDDKHARALVQLIADGAVTCKQGERILAVLVPPEITTRRAYPAGQPARMSVRTPHDIAIPRGRITLSQFVSVAGRPIDACLQRTSRPHILDACVRAPEPGTYHAELHTTCKVWLPQPSPSRWDQFWTRFCGRFLRRPRVFPRTSSELTYECHLVSPFDVNIMKKDQAERLELLTTPQIDASVRAAVVIRTSGQHRDYTPAGWYDYRSSVSIVFMPLPVAIAFELSLRLPDGRELPAQPSRRQHIRLRAGDAEGYEVDVGGFGLGEPGPYAGTLVLTPAPDYAYEDPAIKSLWNGTLEFPIQFTVPAEPNTGR